MASNARSPFSMAREDKGKPEESSEEEEVSHKASLDREENKREPTRPRRTRRSHEERRRDPSYSYARRRESLRKRREEEGGKRRRRHSTGHRRRRSPTPDKRRRSESPAKKKPAKALKEEQRPVSPPGKPPGKPGTARCPHCWADVTTHASGRAQHQWANRTCLQWLFFNEMKPEVKKKDENAAWKQAGHMAAALYERRRWISAPLPSAAVPDPPLPVTLRSRSKVAEKPPKRAEEEMAKRAEEEMEEVVVAEEKQDSRSRPTRSKQLSAGSSGSAPQGDLAPTRPAAGHKQQIVINISS
eukprot:s5370_g2.t1